MMHYKFIFYFFTGCCKLSFNLKKTNVFSPHQVVWYPTFISIQLLVCILDHVIFIWTFIPTVRLFLQCPAAVRKTNNWITNLLHIGRYDNCSKKFDSVMDLYEKPGSIPNCANVVEIL